MFIVRALVSAYNIQCGENIFILYTKEVMKIEKNAVKIGILGFGVVGSGTYKILEKFSEKINNEVGAPIIVEKILVKNLDKKRAAVVPEGLLTLDEDDILKNPNIDIVVELMGGEEPAYTYIKKALENDKHVVTANKELLAKKSHILFQLADEKGLSIEFEASVCGGVPVIKAFRRTLNTDKIKRIMGIVNGTTNYILTKMAEEGSEYSEALKEAQDNGYAETDPTADVEGFDAAYKMAILSSIGFHMNVDINKVKREGITNISKRDILYGKDLGWTIKLIAMAQEMDNKIEVSVSPVMLPKEHPMATVNGVNNAVFVNSESIGELMLYGPGAGQMPTGNSVVSDIVEIARQLVLGNKMLPNCSGSEDKEFMDEIYSAYYIRLNVINKPGVFAKIAGIFGNFEVSLESVLQKKTEGKIAEIVLITSKVNEVNLRNAIESIKDLDVVNEVSSVIRVEDNGKA